MSNFYGSFIVWSCDWKSKGMQKQCVRKSCSIPGDPNAVWIKTHSENWEIFSTSLSGTAFFGMFLQIDKNMRNERMCGQQAFVLFQTTQQRINIWSESINVLSRSIAPLALRPSRGARAAWNQKLDFELYTPHPSKLIEPQLYVWFGNVLRFFAPNIAKKKSFFEDSKNVLPLRSAFNFLGLFSAVLFGFAQEFTYFCTQQKTRFPTTFPHRCIFDFVWGNNSA